MVKAKDMIFQKAYDKIKEWDLPEDTKKQLAKLEKEVIKYLKEVGEDSIGDVLEILVDMLKSLKKRMF